MKLKDYSRKEARNFVISWTAIYAFFSLMVLWSLLAGYKIQQHDPNAAETLLWPHAFLMLLVLLSLVLGVVMMWKRYFSEEFDKVRQARNISFYVVLFIFPLGVLLNLILARI